jgi:chromosomal replication initiator protein
MKEVCQNLNEPDDGQYPSDQVKNTIKKKWEQCLRLIEKEIPWQTLQTWFTPLIPVSYVDDTLTLRVPSRFVFEWVESHFSEILNEIVQKVFGKKSQLEYLITPSQENKKENLDLNLPIEEDLEKNKKSLESVSFKINSHLNLYNTLGNFFIHRKNKIVKKAAEYVSTYLDSQKYNPFFIYGDVGTGKTHVLNAIGNNASANSPEKKIVFLSGEQFLHEYVSAVQRNKINNFKEELSNTDLFLLDDVHYFSGKMNSQESLVYILSQIKKKNRRIVITSNLPPNRLLKFNQRLISIFQMGLISDLEIPESDTRTKIINQYFSENGIQLSDEIIEYLSEKFNSNMHILNSVLVRIVAHVSLLGNPISLDECRHIVFDLNPELQIKNGKIPHNLKITVDKIIHNVGEYFEIPSDVMSGSSRYSKIVLARQIAMYISRKYTGESLSSIGYHFGDRNHASVLYACNKMKKKMQESPELRELVKKMIEGIIGLH